MYELIGRKVNSSETTNEVRSLDRADRAWIRYLCRVDDPQLKIDEDLSDIGLLDLFKSMLTIPAWMLKFLLKRSRFKLLPKRTP